MVPKRGEFSPPALVIVVERFLGVFGTFLVMRLISKIVARFRQMLVCGSSATPQVLASADHAEMKLVTLKVLFFGRTGNLLMQVENSIRAAKYYGHNQVLVERTDLFRKKRFSIDGVRFLNGLGLVNRWLFASRPFQFESTFFALDDIDGDIRKRTALPDVKKIGQFLALEPIPVSDAKSLTIHLRAGDVFTADLPHPNYGQPPLAFYQRILNMENWSKVTLVTEQNSSPILEPLLAFIEGMNLKPVIVTGSALEAFSHLLAATNLCLSNSTFGIMAARISQNISSVFLFDRLYQEFHLENARICRVLDSTGGYRAKIMSKNWTATAEQVRLMREYPVSSLEVECPSSSP